MLFAGLLPNIKGPEAGQPLRLMPWQRLVFANLFGFVERGTTTRRFRQGVVYVPRGNGKTTIAAPIALYLTFVDGEGGAEGYAAAVTRDQARILFDAAQQMVRRSAGLRDHFGVQAGANAIYQESTASRFVPVSSDAKALDGLNVQVAVCDEIASHRTSEVYDVLLTAMGKRRHPLLLSISTATGNTSGIGRQLWDYAARVLDGTQEDDRLFALIYAADPEDDPWDEATWIKANPSWGQAVQPDAIRAIMRQARNNATQETAAKTRHLNIWVGADEALFSTRAWHGARNPDLDIEQFRGKPCHLGLDLASRTDLAALSLVFPSVDPATGKTTYAAFARCYLKEEAVLEARNASYPGWAAGGHLVVTPGNETDFGRIEDNILDLCRRFRVVSIGYDPCQSTQLAQRLRGEGVEMVEFRATTANFSPAILELDAAMRAGRLEHDGNPVLEWCLGNVVGKADRRGNLYPTKARPEQKIDAAVALMMAIGRAMESPAQEVSIFDRPELWTA
ncbi:terminase large subunit [Dankookia rubra]|uniref:Terminase large subunit n=1 Tax=Dankookia rubra TaxID=1442381 RepID=A0A4R5Q9W9_9PROT|nr:terminase TerL endonuclease subunit [Dankookia rubra]TDH59007.1 terminase large subunit [Dankookia rubra]